MGSNTDKSRYRHLLICAREHLGMTRAQLADKLGIDRTFVFRIEAGQLDPRLDTMEDWIKVLAPHASPQFFFPAARPYGHRGQRPRRDRNSSREQQTAA
jgi:DNA-binding XRE family transcriptional regulator